VSRLSFGFRGGIAKVAAGALAVTLLAACETGPVYKPRGPGESVGYTDLQLTPTRYRVTFSGSSSTRREDVENYLLRRSAELALANGFTHFAFDARDTQARTYYRQDFAADPWFGYPYYGRGWYWSSWPYYGAPYRGFGWGGPYGPYGYGGDLRPVTSFSAYAEIVMLNDAQSANNPEAIDAQSLLQRLPPPDAPTTASSSAPPAG
jgi:hypothetical protein